MLTALQRSTDLWYSTADKPSNSPPILLLRSLFLSSCILFFTKVFHHPRHTSIINSLPVPLSSLPWTVFPLPIYPLLSCQLSHLRFLRAAICNHSLFPLFFICLPQTSLQPEHPHFSLPASLNFLLPSFIFSFFLWLLFPSQTHFSLHF